MVGECVKVTSNEQKSRTQLNLNHILNTEKYNYNNLGMLSVVFHAVGTQKCAISSHNSKMSVQKIRCVQGLHLSNVHL